MFLYIQLSTSIQECARLSCNRNDATMRLFMGDGGFGWELREELFRRFYR